MPEPSVIHNTFVLERSYPVKPERTFAAFASPDQKRLWFAEGRSHEVEDYQLDFRVGGKERILSRFKEGSPFPGVPFINELTYQDIVPDKRIVVASIMSIGDNRISASQSTFELLPDGTGTKLVFTEQTAFFEGADGPEMRQQGWRNILGRLEKHLTQTGTPHAQGKA